MRPISLKYTPLATSTTALATSVTGAAFTLTTNKMSDTLGHIVTITNLTSNDKSSINLVITGNDQDGKTQTETITGPTSMATVSSTKYYLNSITVVPASTWGADTASIGYTAVAISPTIPLSYRMSPFNVNLSVEVTGTINVSAYHTLDSPYNSYSSTGVTTIGSQTAVYFVDATIASVAVNTEAALTTAYQATRLKINSVTASATVRYNIIEATEF